MQRLIPSLLCRTLRSKSHAVFSLRFRMMSSLFRPSFVAPSSCRFLSGQSQAAAAASSSSSPPPPPPPTSSGSGSGSFTNRLEVEERILNVVKNFDQSKIDKSKVTPTALFSRDLGLDSLDTVEVVMAIEDEFKIEISDSEAEKIQSIADAINYVAGLPPSPK